MSWAFWAGFALFYAALYATVAGHARHEFFFLLVVDLPMLGLGLALFRRTRPCGLGMLLAAAIFFATALATCGAVLE
jgi:hypothetical protein